MFCPNCNAEVSEAQSFCMNCGTPLKQQNQQQAYVAQPAASAYNAQPTQAAQPMQGAQSTYGQASAQQPSYDAYSAPQGAGGQPYGQSPLPPNGYVQEPAPSNTPFGLAIAGLVCTVIGLFPIGIIFGIVSLVMNSKQKKNGLVSTKQTPTFVMDVINIVLSVIMVIITIVFGAVIVAAIESGEFDDLDINVSSSGSVTATAPSGTSATTDKNSSASSSKSTTSSTTGVTGTTSTTKSIVGTWEIYEVVGNKSADSVSPDDIALMKDRGITLSMTFNSNGTVLLDLIGENGEGTWTMSGSTVTLTFEGDSINMTLNGDDLVLEEDNDKVIFHRA